VKNLQQELQQSKPFASPGVEASLNVTRTATLLAQPFDKLFKEHGLTGTLYNVLRIVRGAGEQGIPCLNIGPRMLSRVPDVTRLVDRLVKLELVDRVRIEEDRRVVLIRLTPKGSTVLDAIEEPLMDLHSAQWSHLSADELNTLNDLLTKARQPWLQA
jgi:DNA-binding MarR family transcriptional regulator